MLAFPPIVACIWPVHAPDHHVPAPAGIADWHVCSWCSEQQAFTAKTSLPCVVSAQSPGEATLMLGTSLCCIPPRAPLDIDPVHIHSYLPQYITLLTSTGYHVSGLRCHGVRSIWTVDLAYLLRRFGLEVELTTITIGANPDYAKESFYKEHMAEDGSRVEKLFQVLLPLIIEAKTVVQSCNYHGQDEGVYLHVFGYESPHLALSDYLTGIGMVPVQEAATAGIIVSRRSVGCRELKDRMLMGGVLVIALVDKTRLAGHTVSAVVLPSVNLGLTARLGIAPAYTGAQSCHPVNPSLGDLHVIQWDLQMAYDDGATLRLHLFWMIIFDC